MIIQGITRACLALVVFSASARMGCADEMPAPELVSRYGNPRDFRIEGASKIQPGEIERAFLHSAEFITASHPAAKFSKLLEVVDVGLERAYRKSGFREPQVEALWDGVKKEVVVKVIEGPRYRLGEIKISGNKVIPAQLIERELAPAAKEMDPSKRRAKEVYEDLLERKRMPEEIVNEAIEKAFPKTSGQEEMDRFELAYLRKSGSFRHAMRVWERGEWIDHRSHTIEAAGILIRSAYAEKGLYAPKIEIELIANQSAEETADLVVKVISEGEAAQFGEIHVSGNQINTKEEILTFLGLEEGLALRGQWMDRVTRLLYQSGRFLGWSLVPRQLVDEPSRVDLLIVVQEEWAAAPLPESLRPEQEALLKVADWLNTKVGEDEDLVFQMAAGGGSEAMELTLVLNDRLIGMSWNGLDHEFDLVIPNDGDMAILAESSRGSFYSSFPSHVGHFRGSVKMANSPRLDPYSKSGWFASHLGVSSLSNETITALKILMDPAAAMTMDRLFKGAAPRVIDGELVILMESAELRFHAHTGKFISLKNLKADAPIRFTGKLEVGAADRLQARLQKKSKGLANWSVARSRSSLAYLGMFFGMEFVDLIEEVEPDLSPSEITSMVADRTARWTSMITFLGETTSGILDGIPGGDGEEDQFKIPRRFDRSDGLRFSGSFSEMATQMGVYAGLSRYFEAGSWPDRVVRECLFVVDGNTSQLNLTIPILLKDEAMGPMGCLICAELLYLMGHPAAPAFLKKAEGELNVEGFEKDWRIFLSGTAGEGGLGWKILNSFQHVTEEDLYRLFGDDQSAMIAPLVDLAKRSSKVEPETGAEELRAIIDVLWEYGVDDAMRQLLEKAKVKMRPRWDPKVVAAVANGIPVFHSEVRLRELITENQKNTYGLSALEYQISETLMALELPKADREKQTQEKFRKFAGRLSQAIGGMEGLKKRGLTNRDFGIWVSTSLYARLSLEQFVRSGEVSGKEVYEFYESDPFFKTEKEIRCHAIGVELADEVGAENKLLSDVRERVLKAGPNRGDMLAAFKKEVAQIVKDDLDASQFDGWLREKNLDDDMADALKGIEDGGVSKVLKIEKKGGKFSSLILVSEPRRRAPYESLRMPAVYRFYRNRLLQDAKIEIIDQGANKEPSGLEKLLEKMVPGLSSMMKSEEKEKVPDGFRNLPRLEQIVIGAKAGKPDDLYVLGTFAERGIAPKENGLEAAMALYLKAAENGSVSAMVRLSEIHRVGRGVKRDAKKAREWRLKAEAGFEKK